MGDFKTRLNDLFKKAEPFKERKDGIILSWRNLNHPTMMGININIKAEEYEHSANMFTAYIFVSGFDLINNPVYKVQMQINSGFNAVRKEVWNLEEAIDWYKEQLNNMYKTLREFFEK